MRPLACLVGWPLLGGCWVTSAEVAERLGALDDTGEAPDEVEGGLEVRSVTPAFGSASGGTEVVLEVVPLGDETVVRFGGTEAEVLEFTAGTVVVRTPPREAAGEVDVEVASGGRVGTRLGGFRYWPAGEGAVGLLGEVATVDYLGEYEAWIEKDRESYAWIRAVQPTALGFSGFFGDELDVCRRGWTYPNPLIDQDTGAQEISLLGSGGVVLELPWDAEADRFEAQLADGVLAPFSTYDLAEVAGEAPWPSFGVPGVVRTPGPLQVTRPDMSGEAPFIDASPTLRWSSSHPGDYVVVRLVRWNGSGSSVVEEVRCWLEDDGEHEVSQAVWGEPWVPFGFVDIHLGRVAVTEVVLPHDGSRADVVGVAWVVGSALAMPASR